MYALRVRSRRVRGRYARAGVYIVYTYVYIARRHRAEAVVVDIIRQNAAACSSMWGGTTNVVVVKRGEVCL